MELNIETLTEEQRKEIELGYKYIIVNGKLKREAPIVFTKENIEYEFNNSIKKITSGYSQAEIDSWKVKEEEAKKVIDENLNSQFLIDLCIEGETQKDLATKIILKANEFRTAYALAEKTKRKKLKALETN